MKIVLNYVVNLLKTMVWPILFAVIEILIVYFIFQLIGEKSMLNNLLISTLITLIIFLPIFIYLNKKNKVILAFNKDLVYIPLVGISLAIFLNIGIICLNNCLGMINIPYDNILLTAILSGIIGPILEELLFRGIVFERLKKFNSLNTSILLSSIIFGLFHNNIIQILYAFVIGYIITILYVKTNNLGSAIIFHISANLSVSLFFNVLIDLPIIMRLIIGIICCFSFLISLYIMNKKLSIKHIS